MIKSNFATKIAAFALIFIFLSTAVFAQSLGSPLQPGQTRSMTVAYADAPSTVASAAVVSNSGYSGGSFPTTGYSGAYNGPAFGHMPGASTFPTWYMAWYYHKYWVPQPFLADNRYTTCFSSYNCPTAYPQYQAYYTQRAQAQVAQPARNMYSYYNYQPTAKSSWRLTPGRGGTSTTSAFQSLTPTPPSPKLPLYNPGTVNRKVQLYAPYPTQPTTTPTTPTTPTQPTTPTTTQDNYIVIAPDNRYNPYSVYPDSVYNPYIHDYFVVA